MDMKRRLHLHVFTWCLLIGLFWPVWLAQAASIHADRARQAKVCRDLVAIIAGTNLLEQSLARSASLERIRYQIDRLDETYRRLRVHVRLMRDEHAASRLMASYERSAWYRPAFRRVAMRMFRRQARGYNCTQTLAGHLGLTEARPGETPRSFRRKGFWSFWQDGARKAALAFLSLAVAALCGLVVRERLEKRREKRYIVRIKTIAEREGRMEAIVIHNISRGGAKVRFLPIRPFRKGERLSLRIGDVFVHGSVVWVGEGMAGIRFDRRIQIPKAYVMASRAVV